MRQDDIALLDGRPLVWWAARLAPLIDSQARAWTRAISMHQALPMLRGFWPMSAVTGAGNAYDQSGGLTLTYNGNPTFNYSALVPYLDFDGTGDYLSRADEAALDILGSESYAASAIQGLTMGCWVYFDNTARAEYYMAKWGGSGQRSYLLDVSGADALTFNVTSDGSTVTTVTSATARTASTWRHMVGRFDPSTELAIFTNGVKASNTTSIPAAIFNSTAAFGIGGDGAGGNLLDGRVALPFLCAGYLSDEIIKALYQESRIAMGV